jgi:hypothetical protein
MIDSTIVRAQRQAATRRKKGALTRLWGALSESSDERDPPAGQQPGPVGRLPCLGRSGQRMLPGSGAFTRPAKQGREELRPSPPPRVELRRMVLDAVVSPHTCRNYSTALDDLFIFSAARPLSRALLMEYRAALDALSPSTVNVAFPPFGRSSPRLARTECSGPRRQPTYRGSEHPAEGNPPGKRAHP